MTEPSVDRVTVRRAPKIPAFLFAGAVLGVLAALILTSLYPIDPAVGSAATYGYFALYGLIGGVVLGAIVGVIVDRVSSRRAKTATVEVTTEQAG